MEIIAAPDKDRLANFPSDSLVFTCLSGHIMKKKYIYYSTLTFPTQKYLLRTEHWTLNFTWTLYDIVVNMASFIIVYTWWEFIMNFHLT